ncbi:MAG: Holliday junction branch migration protein RuvA, partial [Candidatus Margulisiibacteriota bacterium]
GFTAKEEKDFFILLTSVSGIGPKIGINILSQISFKSMIKAIIEKDLLLLKNLSGVGAKKAERLVMELKDKIIKLYPAHATTNYQLADKSNLHQELEQDLKLALKTLGYRTEEINRALSNAASQLNSNLTLETNLKIILKYC